MNEDTLERIAKSLERIADALEPKVKEQSEPEEVGTEFPFWRLSVRTRNAIETARDSHPHKWPWTDD